MLLEVENVVKQYSGHLALDGVSLSVPNETIYGLLGPNGAGKTTLIRIINCITAPDSGEVRLNGKRIRPEDVRLIGYLPEERGLYKKMKVGEQALYLARLKGMSKQDALKALKYWFEKFEIQAWWNKKVEELSKGMAQKVQFITTILHNPELLIFDEPFSGFDPVNTALLKNEILELRDKGATIIFSTHNMSSVEELCENISLVNRSKIMLQGNVADIRASHTTHTFNIRSTSAIDTNLFEVIEQKEDKKGTFESKIKKNPELKNNDLLKELMKQTEIIAFEEILPSMNDIFIETVRATGASVDEIEANSTSED
ncbi:ATP-binding cassette domain-containing protein [Paludibacter sp. 221]|uniref:ABC transporter ATP-binding protein n=1 Tax=Paludibacter sp. 221 TaxID=2302939 RepID=UPI0013CF9F81|nr:ATP-binding cassette domain-containing protein [Paludibacter sp. 221]NDV47872.1 ATP-binding cassette domain-containing protein [Paludibacter sp. 221]